MHPKFIREPRLSGGPEEIDLSRPSEAAAAVELHQTRVHQARRRASDSLARAQEAPEPHDSGNTLFVALYEAHWQDREALFKAMRDLDAAYEELHRCASGAGRPVHNDHRRTG